MQLAVTIRLHGYMDTNTLNKRKRGAIIKELLLKINMQTENKKEE